MRAVTRDQYSSRIESVVELIGRRLDNPPGLEELAAAAHLSRFHFHRVYRVMTGETAARITQPDSPVTLPVTEKPAEAR